MASGWPGHLRASDRRKPQERRRQFWLPRKNELSANDCFDLKASGRACKIEQGGSAADILLNLDVVQRFG